MFGGVRWRDVPGRLAAGAYILHSGMSKRNADQQTAEGLHGSAVRAYPFLAAMDATTFVKRLSATEITVGTLLLTPVVPTAIAGAVLTGFASGLVGLYLRSPGLRRPGSLRPSDQGGAIAKDSWLLGMGLGFLIDAATRR